MTIEKFYEVFKAFFGEMNNYKKEKMLSEMLGYPVSKFVFDDDLVVELIKMNEFRPDETKMIVCSEFAISVEGTEEIIGVLGVKSRIKDLHADRAKYQAPEIMGIRKCVGNDETKLQLAMMFFSKFDSNNLLNCCFNIRNEDGNLIQGNATINDLTELGNVYEFKL